MTCQLVLYNGYGAVLASDSAVTMGNRRVYDTAEKITPLPSPHQMAILWSGSAFLHHFPIQVLLEEYGRSLGPTRLSTSFEYLRKFIEFIETNAFFSDEIQNLNFCRHVDSHLRNLKLEINRRVTQHDRTDQDIARIINENTDHYNSMHLNLGSDNDYFKKIIAENNDNIREIIYSYFNEDERSDTILNPLAAEIESYLTRAAVHGGNTTIAFVGYGRDELMPSCAELTILGFTGNRLQCWLGINEKFDSTDTFEYVGVRQLAQTDAIQTFIRGFARDAHESTRSIIRDTFGQISDATKLVPISENEMSHPDIDNTISKRQEEIRNIAIAKIDELGSAREEEFYDVIAALPPATLATVAESLIGIQALHQAVTAKLNTVGGPIDTAMITRANGFQWIRHKSIS